MFEKAMILLHTCLAFLSNYPLIPASQSPVPEGAEKRLGNAIEPERINLRCLELTGEMAEVLDVSKEFLEMSRGSLNHFTS